MKRFVEGPIKGGAKKNSAANCLKNYVDYQKQKQTFQTEDAPLQTLVNRAAVIATSQSAQSLSISRQQTEVIGQKPS